MPGETIDNLIGVFMAKAGAISDPADLLKGFVAYLKSRGQFFEPGEAKLQFVETSVVRDKNGVKIDVSKCLVCGHEEYEVKKDG